MKAKSKSSSTTKRKPAKSKPPVDPIADDELDQCSILLDQIDALADLFITHGMENGTLDKDREALTLINLIRQQAQSALAILDGWAARAAKGA